MIAMTSDLKYVADAGGHWLVVRRPFEHLPTPAELEAIGFPYVEDALEALEEQVAERRVDQASVREEFRASFDCPYAVQITPAGELATWEACGMTWEEIVANGS